MVKRISTHSNLIYTKKKLQRRGILAFRTCFYFAKAKYAWSESL